jgi:hypothetical protein
VQHGQGLLRPRPAVIASPITQGVAALLFVLMLVDGLREGGFWHADAFAAAVGSTILLLAAAAMHPFDRRSGTVVGALILLAAWWAIRAATAESTGQFLPLGASCLAFAGAFAAVRPLGGTAKQLAGLGVAVLGAAGSLAGFAGLVWRWNPMAMPAQGLWRLSTTLTYSDAAGLALGMCLLVALGVDRHRTLTRVAVCLCGGGLLATQSRGAFVAFALACALVPRHRYLRFLVPLLAGAGLGVVAIATSPDRGSVPRLGVALVVAIAIAAAPTTWPCSAMTPRFCFLAGLVVLAAIGLSALVLHHEIGLRALAPSDHDRSVEWSTALHQWASAPVVGVGPDRLLVFHTADGAYARFAHNEYLQIAADAGIIGLVLLLLAGAAIFRAARRFDVLSSCACAALVCCAVGGAFDFDWHLTFVGFLGGWCAGLATDGGSSASPGSTDRPSSRKGERPRLSNEGARIVAMRSTLARLWLGPTPTDRRVRS